VLIVAWLEVGYVSYVSALNDLAINEAAQVAKTDKDSYLDSYQAVLNDQSSIWNQLVDVERVVHSVRYVKDIDALSKVSEKCEPEEDAEDQTQAVCGTEEDSAIAIYYMSYKFSGLFSSLLDSKLTAAREVIVIQEYERDKFAF
jgi:tight adherence protein E